MSFAPKFFSLCLFLCLCNGSPPKAVSRSSGWRVYSNFTEEEDKFIIQELLSVPGDSVPINGKDLWEYLEKKHHELWKRNTFGFPVERSGRALRQRLTRTLIRNYPHVKVKVPEILLRRFPLLDKNRPNQAPRQLYTSEEEEFILEELLKPSCYVVYATPTWEAIKSKHDAKRKEGCQGFETERTAGGLRSHMIVMRRGGLLPDEVLRKLPTTPEAGRSDKSTPSELTTVLQDTDENEDDDEWVRSVLQNPVDDVLQPDWS